MRWGNNYSPDFQGALESRVASHCPWFGKHQSRAHWTHLQGWMEGQGLWVGAARFGRMHWSSWVTQQLSKNLKNFCLCVLHLLILIILEIENENILRHQGTQAHTRQHHQTLRGCWRTPLYTLVAMRVERQISSQCGYEKFWSHRNPGKVSGPAWVHGPHLENLWTRDTECYAW